MAWLAKNKKDEEFIFNEKPTWDKYNKKWFTLKEILNPDHRTNTPKYIYCVEGGIELQKGSIKLLTGKEIKNWKEPISF